MGCTTSMGFLLSSVHFKHGTLIFAFILGSPYGSSVMNRGTPKIDPIIIT